MNKTEIQNLIKELIEKTTISVSKISIDEDKPTSFNKNGESTWFGVEVDQPHFFWERGGEALFALNHLISRIIENKMMDSKLVVPLERQNNSIVIDINGFQKKRVESIHAIAHMMAERARYFKSNIEVDPMSAFERRIVHEFLSDAIDLKTESIDFGPKRRVVIKYTGN